MYWVSNRRKRKLLFEAFVGGWQAALGTKVTNPRALKVLETCFELWLEDAAGEVDVLGLRFRKRSDIPRTTFPQSALKPYRRQPSALPRIPTQRTGSEDVTSTGAHRRSS